MNPQASQPNPTPDATNARQQVLEQIKRSNNVLLTVSENPTVDQLAAVIGMTLLLNKLDKHATAVFSGQVPSTIEFLQPDKTLEKTTDSLRDFIISLDKSKADKLRYKIEDKYVKIFITPYHTSLSDKDLEFSQGDFNVDLVLALGVKKREELDQAITVHGRILHDATVVSINTTPGADMGSINWVQTDTSGLSEMLVSLSDELKNEEKPLLDQQIATCFLTGIVAQTGRFSNSKTNPQTMSLAAKLMNAGANQQLIATKLEPPAPIPPKMPEPPKPAAPLPKPPEPPKPAPLPAPKPEVRPPAGPARHAPEKPLNPPKPEAKATEDGSLLVPHDGVTGDSVAYAEGPEEDIAKIHIDDQGTLKRIAEEEQAAKGAASAQNSTQPQQPLPAQPAPPEPAAPAMNLPVAQPPQTPAEPLLPPAPPTPADAKPILPKVDSTDTLQDLEQSVNSPHLREVDSLPNPPTNPQPPTESQLPPSLIGPDKGLPPDQTAGNPNPTPPPPVPPPITITPPPPANMAPGNMSDPNSGVPL